MEIRSYGKQFPNTACSKSQSSDVLIWATFVHLVILIRTRKLKVEIENDITCISASQQSAWKMEEEWELREMGD